MGDSIRFVMGDRIRTIRQCDPTLTVLDYLRNHAGRKGTKEGCAEGDCGACTVVLGELRGERVHYRAVNACIVLLASIHGKLLITVEDLKGLHPVQQAMVDQHGSQCGFCTPGFVMSLYAMHQTVKRPVDRQQIDDGIAGNLCRCTGYKPIVRAAEIALNQHDPEPLPDQALNLLKQIQDQDGLQFNHGSRKYFAPRSMDELCVLLNEHPDACMVAGNTDVGLWITKKLQVLDTVIYLGSIKEMNTFGLENHDGQDYFSIGAGVTYSDSMELICRQYPDLEPMLRRLGATQVRNAGTIGGNIANGSPIGDMPPALIALNSRLILRSSQGQRMIALEDFFIDYGVQDLQAGEFVEAVLLPVADKSSTFRCYKLSKRFDQDISAVCAAFKLKLKDGKVDTIRIAYGGMAATPKRASHCEQALNGQSWDQTTVEAAKKALEDDFTPISDMRASMQYRQHTAANLLQRFYLETSTEHLPVTLTGTPVEVADHE